MDPNNPYKPVVNPATPPSVPPASVGTPLPPPGPKVFDLSALNAAGSRGGNIFFKNKTALLGILFVLVLAVGVTFFGLKFREQQTTPPPKAAGCDNYKILNDFTGSSGAKQDTAWATGTVQNNCDAPINFYIIKSWCLTVDVGHNGGCGAPNTTGDTITAPPHKGTFVSRPQTDQKVGNTGTCGSAQVDIAFTQNASGPKDRGATAFLDPCQPTSQSTVVCDSLTISPTSGQTPLKVTATIAGHVTGNAKIQRYHFNFGDGAASRFVQDQPKASYTYKNDGTFNISGVILDTAGNQATGPKCQATLTTSSTPTTFSHNVCNAAHACVSAPCDPATTDCSLTTDCKTSADCVVTTFSHNVCNANHTCASVPCDPATTDCSLSTDCKTNADCAVTFNHNVCNSNNSCVSQQCSPANVDCSSSSDCKTNTDCVPQTFQHKVCLGSACTSVDCSPNTASCASSCSDDSECGGTSTATHHECNQNNSCVVVTGAGTDQCTSDASCAPAATPPAIPKSGNTMFTLGGAILGIGAILAGILLAL